MKQVASGMIRLGKYLVWILTIPIIAAFILGPGWGTVGLIVGVLAVIGDCMQVSKVKKENAKKEGLIDFSKMSDEDFRVLREKLQKNEYEEARDRIAEEVRREG